MVIKIFIYLQPKKNGRVAEWLGSGLQIHVRRFESVRDLQEKLIQFILDGLFGFIEKGLLFI